MQDARDGGDRPGQRALNERRTTAFDGLILSGEQSVGRARCFSIPGAGLPRTPKSTKASRFSFVIDDDVRASNELVGEKLPGIDRNGVVEGSGRASLDTIGDRPHHAITATRLPMRAWAGTGAARSC